VIFVAMMMEDKSSAQTESDTAAVDN